MCPDVLNVTYCTHTRIYLPYERNPRISVGRGLQSSNCSSTIQKGCVYIAVRNRLESPLNELYAETVCGLENTLPNLISLRQYVGCVQDLFQGCYKGRRIFFTRRIPESTRIDLCESKKILYVLLPRVTLYCKILWESAGNLAK